MEYSVVHAALNVLTVLMGVILIILLCCSIYIVACNFFSPNLEEYNEYRDRLNSDNNYSDYSGLD